MNTYWEGNVVAGLNGSIVASLLLSRITSISSANFSVPPVGAGAVGSLGGTVMAGAELLGALLGELGLFGLLAPLGFAGGLLTLLLALVPQDAINNRHSVRQMIVATAFFTLFICASPLIHFIICPLRVFFICANIPASGITAL